MTYATIESRLQEWTADSDTEFTSNIPDVISLAELRVAKDLNCDAMRLLRTGTISTGDDTIARLATTVAVRWIAITVGTAKQFLSLRQDTWIRARYPNTTDEGVPAMYAFQDEDTILIGPPSDDDYPYEMMTEERVVGLTSSQETYLSERHDDLLFYASLLESGALQENSEDFNLYKSLYERSLQTAKEEVVRGRMDANSVNR